MKLSLWRSLSAWMLIVIFTATDTGSANIALFANGPRLRGEPRLASAPLPPIDHALTREIDPGLSRAIDTNRAVGEETPRAPIPDRAGSPEVQPGVAEQQNSGARETDGEEAGAETDEVYKAFVRWQNAPQPEIQARIRAIERQIRTRMFCIPVEGGTVHLFASDILVRFSLPHERIREIGFICHDRRQEEDPGRVQPPDNWPPNLGSIDEVWEWIRHRQNGAHSEISTVAYTAGDDRVSETACVYADGTTRYGRRTNTPLVFDLAGAGIRTSPRKVLYDIAGSGRPAAIDELGPGVGLLVFDPNRSGVPGKSGLELFGDRTDLRGTGTPSGFRDGFEAFDAFILMAISESVLDPQVLGRKRLDAADLAGLEAAYGLKMKVGGMNGKAVSLKEAGVAGILLSSGPAELDGDFDGRGNGLSRRKGAAFIRSDGSVGDYADIWFRYQAPSPRDPAARMNLLRFLSQPSVK